MILCVKEGIDSVGDRQWGRTVQSRNICSDDGCGQRREGVTDTSRCAGLAAAVISKDEARCRRMTEAFRSDIVWVN